MRRVERWDAVRMGPLCLESVQSLHQPRDLYRISLTCYPAGTSFQGEALGGRRYVLSGACSFTVKELVWELQTGDIADIPEGGYKFRVLGGGPIEFVSVWELPPELGESS